MKKAAPILFFFFLFLCVSAGGFSVYCYFNLPKETEPPMGPLVATPATIDFGRVESEKRLEGSATITNVSKRSVTITDVLSSCTCSGVTLEKGVLPPGKNIELTAFMETRGREGKTAAELIVLYIPEGGNEKTPAFLAVKLHADISGIQATDQVKMNR